MKLRQVWAAVTSSMLLQEIGWVCYVMRGPGDPAMLCLRCLEGYGGKCTHLGLALINDVYIQGSPPGPRRL